MENVWLAVGLENFAEHPMNRGWMNWFRRWSGSESFQKHWPTLRGEFSQDFVRFAEKQLNLRVGRPDLIAYPTAGTADAFQAAIRRLDAEYILEWADHIRGPADRTIDLTPRPKMAVGPPEKIVAESSSLLPTLMTTPRCARSGDDPDMADSRICARRRR